MTGPRIQIKLYGSNGKNMTRPHFEHMFEGMSDADALAAYEAICSVARYYSASTGNGKKSISPKPDPDKPEMHEPSCATRFRGPFPGPCNCSFGAQHPC